MVRAQMLLNIIFTFTDNFVSKVVPFYSNYELVNFFKQNFICIFLLLLHLSDSFVNVIVHKLYSIIFVLY